MLAFAIAFLFGTCLARTQDQAPGGTNAPPLPTTTNRWHTTASVGLTLTRGNSETLLCALSLDTKGKWDHNEVALGVAGGYGEDQDVKNTEFINAFGQYNHLLNERFYAGLRTDFSYDGIAHLSHRVTVSPLAGYYLIRRTNTTLTVEAGPSVVFEKYEDRSENTYFGFRLAEHFEQKISATTKLWQSASYVPEVEKWSDKYIITTELGIDTAITKRWSLRVVFQDIYDSQPASNSDQNDMRLVAGAAYKF